MSDEWEECEYSGLARAFCAHCRGDKLGDEQGGESIFDELDEATELGAESDYEVTKVFQAAYPGTCNIDRSHRIKRGDRVGRVQRSDNPMLTVGGVCCSRCVSDYPRVS